MNEIVIPLVSPLSRKYYAYASEKSEHKHHQAEDVRICLEYICDHIIYIFVSEEDKEKWKKYKLDKKIKASRSFLDDEIVNKLLSAKCIGNAGVHEGEEGNYSEQDIVASLVVIREFSLRIFYAYFEKYGFGYTKNSWMPTVFSTLPPMYRVGILEKYYNNCDKSVFVIDKLSKAYLKSGKEQKARTFLRSLYEANEITCEIYEVLDNDISLLKENLKRLPIATDLEMSKDNFNSLLPEIAEDERDSFICLMSMILNGLFEKDEKSKE